MFHWPPPLPPPEPPAAARPAGPPVWRRLWGAVPPRTWAAVAAVQFAVALPFWLYWSPAPLHPLFGDVYRGWPLIYGLDQGDFGGDELGPFTAHFRPDRFALDTAVAVGCALPLTVPLFWRARVRRRQEGVENPVG